MESTELNEIGTLEVSANTLMYKPHILPLKKIDIFFNTSIYMSFYSPVRVGGVNYDNENHHYYHYVTDPIKYMFSSFYLTFPIGK